MRVLYKKTTPAESGSGGRKLLRSEVLQVRLDPKSRFAVELAAMEERRSLNSFIDNALAAMVKQTSHVTKDGATVSIERVAHSIWHTDEANRFVRMAYLFPELLKEDEQRKWLFICEHRCFWAPSDQCINLDDEIKPKNGHLPNFQIIRRSWELLNRHVQKNVPFDWNAFALIVEEAAKDHITTYYWTAAGSPGSKKDNYHGG
jgi:hypothetical protein